MSFKRKERVAPGELLIKMLKRVSTSKLLLSPCKQTVLKGYLMFFCHLLLILHSLCFYFGVRRKEAYVCFGSKCSGRLQRAARDVFLQAHPPFTNISILCPKGKG